MCCGSPEFPAWEPLDVNGKNTTQSLCGVGCIKFMFDIIIAASCEVVFLA